MARLLRGLFVVVAAVLALPTPAFAHGGTDRAGYSNYRTTVTAITPDVPGVQVEITDTSGGIRLTYTGTEPLYVLGYDNEPYLRLGPDGAFANRNSPATYVNLRSDANVPVPEQATSDATPDWHQLSTRPTVLWHDHRLHWMSSTPPDIVRAAPGSPHVVNPEWTIPLLVGNERAEITGQLLWEPSPSRTAWLLVALTVFVAAVLLLQLPGWWRPVTVGLLGLGLGANLVVAGGRSAVVHGGFGTTLAPFTLAAVIAVLGGITLWTLRGRARPSWWSAAAGAALLAGGLAYLQMLSYSQLHSSVDATLNRIAVVVELGVGAAVLAAAVIGRLAPVDEPEPVSVTGADPAA